MLKHLLFFCISIVSYLWECRMGCTATTDKYSKFELVTHKLGLQPPPHSDNLTNASNNINIIFPPQTVTRILGFGYPLATLRHSVQCQKAYSKAMQSPATIKWSFKNITQDSFNILYKTYIQPYVAEIGGPGGPWPLLNLRPLHRNVIFAIENLQFSKVVSVASSASVFNHTLKTCIQAYRVRIQQKTMIC